MLNSLNRINFHQTLILFIFFLFTTSLCFADKEQKHPIAQLVEWEVLANPALDESTFQRMARSIILLNDIKDLPQEIINRIDYNNFLKMYHYDQINELGKQLTPEQLKQIAILPGRIQYFEFTETEKSKLVQYNHELPNLSQISRELVVAKRNGEKVYRWFIHPMNEATHSDIAKTYEKIYKSMPSVKSGDIQFQFTSSRSVIVFKDDYTKALSIKLSLPAAEGPFGDKRINFPSLTAWARHNQYLSGILDKIKMQNLNLLYEPFAFGANHERHELMDGLITRDISVLTKRQRYYLPAFAALTDTVGIKIAEINGSTNPLKFWEQHLLIPLAKSMAELRALTGAEHTSAHSQNILIELDKNYKVTGKIVLRDFDFYIDDLAIKQLNNTLDHKGLTYDETGNRYHQFSLINGLPTRPQWLSVEHYEYWIRTYFDIYRNRFSEVSGVSVDQAFTDRNIYVKDGRWYSTGKEGFLVPGGKLGGHFMIYFNKEKLNEYYKTQLVHKIEQYSRQGHTPKSKVKNQRVLFNQVNVLFSKKLLSSNIEWIEPNLNLITNIKGILQFNLQEQKDLFYIVNSYNLKFMLNESKRSKLSLKLIRILFYLEPSLVGQLGLNREMIKQRLKSSPILTQQIMDYIDKGERAVELLKTLQEGNLEKVQESSFINELRTLYPEPRFKLFAIINKVIDSSIYPKTVKFYQDLKQSFYQS